MEQQWKAYVAKGLRLAIDDKDWALFDVYLAAREDMVMLAYVDISVEGIAEESVLIPFDALNEQTKLNVVIFVDQHEHDWIAIGTL